MPSDASTKRRDGNVGSPCSCAPPSAVSPRCTTANAHSASEPVDGRRQREVRAQPMVARPVVELVRDAEEALAGAQLERGA